MDTTQILMAVIGAMWTILLAVVGYGVRRLSEKVDSLIIHREDCISRFADRENNERSHARLFEKHEDHERRLAHLEARVRQ